MSTTSPRLVPIDRPRGLLLRLFNWLTRRRFGKEMTPARVIYARLPSLLWRTLPMYGLMERGLTIEKDLRLLIEVHVSRVNRCAFCIDLHQAVADREQVPEAKLEALHGDFERAASLTERERAALRYVDEVARTGGASIETFEALREQFSEREIVEVTWLSAFTTYLNRLALPLGIGSDGFCPQR